MLKVLHVVGTRPNFVKLAPVHSALREAGGFQQIIVHTDQHYDTRMSSVFFEELALPEADVHLDVGSGSHAQQTARTLLGLEPVLLDRTPDWVVTVGDVNSTLGGALAAAKLGLAVAHVEAGLRTFERQMPEELNRVLVDRLSHLLLCPSDQAAEYLRLEGLTSGVHVVGDVMYDALLASLPRLDSVQLPSELNGLQPGTYALATIHRAANTDDHDRLAAVLACLAVVDADVVLPLHPRTAARLGRYGLTLPSNLRIVEPVTYLQMLRLERGARLVLTDSGGVQKEAFWLGVRCITLRDETEWPETAASGWNHLVGADPARTQAALALPPPATPPPPVYGDGRAARRIAELLSQCAS